MRKIGKLCIFVLLLIVAVIGFGHNTYAVENRYNLTLHEKTKIYSNNNDDWFEGCEDFSDYKSSAPAITVLTHGYGGDASHWSNDKESNFAYNRASLITKIAEKNKYNIDVYLACCNKNKDFKLVKYQWDLSSPKEVERINDASKHIVLLFQSGDSEKSNTYVYEEFENVVDTISLQYKSLTGVLPRLNLIGHSRGGITNIMYATEHPYNVASIFSLGTPYNGSVFGENCDFMMEILKFASRDEARNLIYTEGVKSLLDKNECKTIRDKWNEAYKSDVSFHVTAFGSITSFNYLTAFIDDISNSNFEYKDELSGFMSALKDLANKINEDPEKSLRAFNEIKTTSSVLSYFSGINIYEIAKDIACMFEESLKNFCEEYHIYLSVQDVNNILNLFSILNGEAVILDDLFIDLNSQLGLFSDGNDYKGFNRHLKVFESKDLNEYRSIPSAPAVVHNMEAFNEEYLDIISDGLIYGHSDKKMEKLDEFGDFTGFISDEKVLEFYSCAGGIRKVSSNCEYYILDNDCVSVDIENDEVYLSANKTYFFVLQAPRDKYVDISIDVKQEFGEFEFFERDSKQIFRIKNLSKGFYCLKSSNLGTKFYNMNGDNISYIYSEGEEFKYSLIAESIEENTILSFGSIDSLIADNKEVECSDLQLFQFKNEYDTPLKYEVSIPDSTSILILSENNNVISTSVLIQNGVNTYIVTLDKNQTIYIFVEKQAKVKVKLADEQMFWFKVMNNGKEEIITDDILNVNPGDDFILRLKLQNGQNYKYLSSKFILTDYLYGISYSSEKIYVSDNALIGKEVIISHQDYKKSTNLKLYIVPDKYISWSIENMDEISISWSFNYSSSQITRIDFEYSYINDNNKKIIDYDSTINNQYTFNLKKLNQMNQYLQVKLTAVYYENGKFDSGYFCNSEQTLCIDYCSGRGMVDDPYIISCKRHLENIKKNSSAVFKLDRDITLSTWTPIPFNGVLDGDKHTISYMNVDCNGNSNYGLISLNTGLIQYLTISNACLNSSIMSSNAYGGIIVGYNKGNVESCKVEYSTIDAVTVKASFGGIAGVNDGYIFNCDIMGLTMVVSARAGGIAGLNTGKISLCKVKNTNITYQLVDGINDYPYCNGLVGGCVGYNKNGVVSNCYSSGNFYWLNDTNNNREIYPSLGKIVGLNSNNGTIIDCGSDMVTILDYFYWYFVGWYDQSGRCFKFEGGLIGHQE